MTGTESRVAERIRTTHRETLTEIRDVADELVETTGRRVDDSQAIVEPLRAAFDERNLLGRLCDVLVTGVAATGAQLQAEPIAGPPYVVVTSRGPLCRGTLTDGRRLVIEVRLFAVGRRPRSYSYLAPTPADCVTVSLRHAPD